MSDKKNDVMVPVQAQVILSLGELLAYIGQGLRIGTLVIDKELGAETGLVLDQLRDALLRELDAGCALLAHATIQEVAAQTLSQVDVENPLSESPEDAVGNLLIFPSNPIEA